MSPKHRHRASSLGLIAGILLAASSGLAPASAAEPPPPPATQSSVRSIEDIRAALDYFESSTRRSEMRADGRKTMTPEEVEIVRQAMRDCVILIARENPDAAVLREVKAELVRAALFIRLEHVPAAQREGLWTDAFAAAPIEATDAWIAVAGTTQGEPGVLGAWCAKHTENVLDRSLETDMRVANAVGHLMRHASRVDDLMLGLSGSEPVAADRREEVAIFVDELTRTEWERMASEPPASWLDASPEALRAISSRHMAGLAGEQEVLDLANAFLMNPELWEPAASPHLEGVIGMLMFFDRESTGGRRGPVLFGLHRARVDGGGFAVAEELLPLEPSSEPPLVFGSLAEVEDYMATLPPPPPRAAN